MDETPADLRFAEIWLHDNASRNISMANLANHLGYSESHLRRIFLREFGYSPGRYRDLLRVEKASLLLARTGLPIIEVSNLCGYTSHPIFTRAFRQKRGISPRAYRMEAWRHLRMGNSKISCIPDSVSYDIKIFQDIEYEFFLARHYGHLATGTQQKAWHYYTSSHLSPSVEYGQAAWIWHGDSYITPKGRFKLDLGFRCNQRRPGINTRLFRHTMIRADRAVRTRFKKAEDIPWIREYLLLKWLPERNENINGEPMCVVFDAQDSCDGAGHLTLPLHA
ncbi:helix-turn-helix transcriptional regulator [Halomonas sp. ML-15]|uniref:helix-turn-helix transcriptional regulator n=1 Tax=Halomonas sp. ML-15 TaxID=2773305 RepID=UPI0017479AC4|nr:AraC family transcriptional regulator [Halomonas sp. ML-15]MBD3898073.1 helix-turn-helix transcriptional regulator [Halomonas sp. ML-15]